MTMAIAAHCNTTGQVGIAITTSSICVGSRCPWVRAGVGAIATQNVTNPELGLQGLDLMQQGLSAPAVLHQLLEVEAYPEFRQLILVDCYGNTAHFSGEKSLGIYNHAVGDRCIAAGNLLAHPGIPAAMIAAFEAMPDACLSDRLLNALSAALDAGGEQGDVRSAALLVADQEPWPEINLRVDWDQTPVSTLQSLWEMYRPQLHDYVTRAHNPAIAPSYGVPGDL